jgi:hypothetical protein
LIATAIVSPRFCSPLSDAARWGAVSFIPRG